MAVQTRDRRVQTRDRGMKRKGAAVSKSSLGLILSCLPARRKASALLARYLVASHSQALQAAAYTLPKAFQRRSTLSTLAARSPNCCVRKARIADKSVSSSLPSSSMSSASSAS
eukprot:441399-Pleurochrysis_carterae.AAC.1